MESQGLLFIFFVIFCGASILATIALFTKQAVIIAYIILGMILGPYGFKLINNTDTIMEISSIGIMFLLFLLGLNLNIQELIKSLSKTFVITFISSTIFIIVPFAICYIFGIGLQESIIIGISFSFSSTIICLKLLPTTALHHKHIGNLVISILLLQDIFAILALIVLGVMSVGIEQLDTWKLITISLAMPSLYFIALIVQKFILLPLMKKFNRFREYLFLLPIGWCLSLAELGYFLGVSHEIGAFIAGVSLASSPISQYIYESLKPIRDFFLIIFFFSVGANFNFFALPSVLGLVIVLTIIILILKPFVYWFLLKLYKEKKTTRYQVGIRLGQASEFSLLIGVTAFSLNLISNNSYIVIQAVTILTFFVSSYYVVLRLPNPIAIYDHLRKD